MIVREKPVEDDPAELAGVPLGALGGDGGSSEWTPVASALAGELVAREGNGANVASSAAGSCHAALEWPRALDKCPSCAPLPPVSASAQMSRAGDVGALIGGGAAAVVADVGAASASAPVDPPGPFGVLVAGPAVVAREGTVSGVTDANDRVAPAVGAASRVPASPSSVAGVPALIAGWPPSAEAALLVSEATRFTASVPLGSTCGTLGASFATPWTASPPCCTTCVTLGASFATPFTTACGSRLTGVLAATCGAIGTLTTACSPDTVPVAACTTPPAGFAAAEASEVAALVAAVVVASAAGTTWVAPALGAVTGAAVATADGTTGEVDGAAGEGACTACVTVLSVASNGPAASAGVAERTMHRSATSAMPAALPILMLER